MQVWSFYVLQLSLIPHLLIAERTGIKYFIMVFSVLKNRPFCFTVIPIQIPNHVKTIAFWMYGSENCTDMTN